MALRPVCEVCRRAIPAGVDAVLLDGNNAICGPCLWDSYTPTWRQHQQHTQDYATCTECGAPRDGPGAPRSG